MKLKELRFDRKMNLFIVLYRYYHSYIFALFDLYVSLGYGIAECLCDNT